MTAEKWTMPAAPESAHVARRLARAYATRHGADRETVADVARCVSEAVTNAVLHAYRDPGEQAGEVELEARRPDGYLCLYVRDRGVGMAPRVGSPGLGLGLPIIAGSASGVELRNREDGGTEIVMRFELDGAGVGG